MSNLIQARFLKAQARNTIFSDECYGTKIHSYRSTIFKQEIEQNVNFKLTKL